MTPEEMAEINFRMQIVSAMVEAREKSKITQKELERMTNIHQPTIAKIENGKVDPQVTTVLKLLAPLGKTLAVVPMEEMLNT
jgi:predicted transcriptional regulator